MCLLHAVLFWIGACATAGDATATPRPEVARHLALGDEHVRRGHVSDAEMEYAIVLKMDPGNLQATEGLALAHATPTPALALQEEQLNLAERAYHESRLDEVEARARGAIEVSAVGPGAVWARELLATVAAERFLVERTAEGEYANNVRALYEEGMALMRSVKYRDACNKLSQAQSLAVRNAQVAKYMDRACELADDERETGSLVILEREAGKAEASGDFSGAASRWREAVRRDPSHRKAAEHLAACEARIGTTSDARRAAGKARFEEGERMLAEGKRAQARQYFREAMELDSTLVIAAERLAEPRPRKRGKPKAGNTTVTGPEPTPAATPTAAAPGPSPAERKSLAQKHYRQGIALFQDGKYAEAKTEFEQALFLEPGHAQALEGKKRCDTLLSR